MPIVDTDTDTDKRKVERNRKAFFQKYIINYSIIYLGNGDVKKR